MVDQAVARGERAHRRSQAREERRLGPRRRRPRARATSASSTSWSRRSGMTLEEIDERHPELDPRAARRTRTSAGCSSRSAQRGAGRARARTGRAACDDGRVEGEDPLAAVLAHRRAAPAAHGRLRALPGHPDRQLLRPVLDEGCAFEELISFHGGLGGPQTRAFILSPPSLAAARASRSSAPRRCTACSRAGAGCSRAARHRLLCIR